MRARSRHRAHSLGEKEVPVGDSGDASVAKSTFWRVDPEAEATFASEERLSRQRARGNDLSPPFRAPRAQPRPFRAGDERAEIRDERIP